MDAQSLLALKVICWVIGAFSGLAGAWFQLRDRWQTDEEHEEAKNWYAEKWRTIKRTGVLQLPAKVIGWVLRARSGARRIPEKLFELIPGWLIATLLYGMPLMGAVGGWLLLGWIGAIAVALLPGAFVGHMFVPFPLLFPTPKEKRLEAAINVVWLIGWLVVTICWLRILMSLSVVFATLLVLLFLPAFTVATVVPLTFLPLFGGELIRASSVFNDDTWILLGPVVMLSLFVTLSSLLVGHAVDPDAWVPQTMQMLLSNVLFDCVSLWATLLILGAAVSTHRHELARMSGSGARVHACDERNSPTRNLPIPVAIAMDVVLAALLACASLWFGLIGTDSALSVRQVWWVLIGQSADGTRLVLGPYFWVMHTTFLPTLFYLSVILLCWIGRLLVLPVAKILKRAAVVDQPHGLTAGTLLFVAAAFTLLAAGIGQVQEAAR